MKSIYPAPVYEAHFDSGEIMRMSFWTKNGKPFDVERARELCQGFRRNVSYVGTRRQPFPSVIVDGYIEDKRTGQRYRDAFYAPSMDGVYIPDKPKRASAKAMLERLVKALRAGQDWKPLLEEFPT